VSSYCASVGLGNPAVANAVVPAGLGGAGAGGVPAGMVAVRVADVAGGGGGSALVVAGGEPVRSGQSLVFCHPVVVAPAVVGRDGRVLAGGWLPDQVRLGLLEAELGEGVIEQVVTADDRVDQSQRLRIMSVGLTVRLVIAMTLMPEASAREVLARLVGLVAKVPFARAWAVPGSKVITAWRRRVGAGVLRTLFWRSAGPITPHGGDPDGLLGDLLVCAVDGFQARLADTPANRDRFGGSGTSEGAGSFPQLRAVLATAWTGRAVLGAAMDASGVGEQTLLARLVTDHPELFGPGRVFLVDRNFLGYDLITQIVARGAQLVMRVKAGITLHHVRWLPEGSQLVYLTAPDRCSVLMLRAVEYTVETPTGASELFCLATTLLDHHTYPATAIRDTYPKRWAASETTIGENKSTITDAGPSRGPILRSKEPELVEQEFWAWLTSCQLTRKAAATAAASATANPAQPRPAPDTTTQRDAAVSTGQVSFTGVRNEATRSMTQTLVTATTTTAALTAHAHTAADMILTNLVTTNRQRSSQRTRKHQPRFPHTPVTKTTRTGHATITMFHPHTTSPPTPQPPDTS
jgi:Insertion element 4 transposase N-terminal/Transposase DDE domain